MAVIKKFAETLTQNLTTFQTYLVDNTPNSTYFRVTEFKDTFTGGKNGFLIEGSEHLKETTEIKIQILDVAGNPVYFEPGNGVPEYYEGISKLIAVYVYEDTPIGNAKITILGELKTFVDDNGIVQDIPEQWRDVYNLKWEKNFQINKLLSNEDKVRFYRRPEVSINEIVKPIFSNVVTPITQMGFVDGFAQVPAQGEKLTQFTLPTNYLIQINDGGAWTGSIVGTNIEFTDLGFSSVADDVISKTDLTVTTPYSINGIVQNFSNQRYTASFNYVEGVDNLATALTGSFGKITISDLETFVGDVARVKIYRKSQSDLADYQFIQEIQLESNELLKDLESTTKNEEFYGIFDQFNFKNYWITSSNELSTQFNQTFLYNSVRLDGNAATANQFFTSKSIDLTENSEYTLDFNVRLSQNTSAGNYIRFYISGSRTINNITTGVSQEILKITSDNTVLQKSNVTANFQSQQFSNAKLYIEVKGTGWHVADISLRASQESSFSPNEISFVQPIPRTLPKETFDFLFQFYDINNNYIPIIVTETKTFDGGNLNRINKSLELIPSSLYFQFDSGSGNGNPVNPTTIFIDVVKNFLTGSVTFTSRSFDFFNTELSSSMYDTSYWATTPLSSSLVSPPFTHWQFPGQLLDTDQDTVRLTVQNFTGSRDPGLEEITVQYIEYTAECEGVEDSIIITRVIDGKGGVNYELRPYNGQFIRNSDPSGSLEVQAIRIDGVNEIKLRAGLPAGRSAPQIHVQSGSTYITLNDASASGFIYGLQPGTTGSGELNYNAIFNRDSIDGQLTLYLIPSGSPTPSASVLTVLTLTDLQDGLDAGVVLYDADTFTINPRLQTTFTPTFSSATASFFRRGKFDEPISCSIEVYPSMSINNDFVPEYWVNYITHSSNPDISVVAYDEVGNIITSSLDAATYAFGNPLLQSKQLLVNFVYTEPWTSASVSVDKLFTIVPEGKPGDESIVFEVTPSSVTLAANSRGIVNDFKPTVTDIRLKQGSRYLSFTGSREPGTFHIAQSSITASNVTGGLVYFDNAYTESLIISASSGFINLSGSITYPLEIQPYYTSSVYTASVVQQYTKVLEGPPPIQILISPPNVTLTADEVGFITPVGYAPANTTLQVKEGDDFLRFTTQSNLPGTWRINSIETRGGFIWNIRTGSLSSSSLSTATINYNRFDYPYVSASALYTIQVYPFALGSGHEYTSSIFTRTQTFTKNVSVPNARSVDFKASSYTVNYDRNGRVSPASAEPIILSATAFNTTASAGNVRLYLYDIASDGSEGGEQIFTGDVGSNPITFTLPDVNYYDIGPDTIKTYKVKLTDGNVYTSPTVNPFRAEAQLTISGMKAGADSYKLVSTNDNCSITADLWTTQFSGSGMKITTFNGTQQLTNANPLPLPNDPNDLDFNNEPIGVLGFSSASIVTKSNYITLPSQLTDNPATIGNITDWVAPAINNAGTIVYRVDFEGDSSTTNASIRPLARQTQFVTQSISVQFTPPAPYDVKMTNENTPVVYKVAGNISFDGTGTTIRAYRGNIELINTASFVGPVGGQNDAYGRYGYPNKSRVSILSKSDHISLGGGLVPGQHVPGNPATMPNIIGWDYPATNATGEIVYQIDCEYSGSLISGSTLFKTQSLAIQYEGAVGPGIVMRGEWTGSIDYIGQVETTNNRRDAVTYLATSDTVKYYAAKSGSGPNTGDNSPHPPTVDGNNDWWEYLGEQDFFVAAKIAIFEESYVKNTINVGTKDGTGAFANIVLAGGRPDPYIAIGQNATVGTAGTSGTTNTTGVIGYNKPGIFLGIYEDGGAGTTGRFSIKTTGTSGKGLFWDGDNLTVVGGIRQREPGIPEGAFRGAWASGVVYYPDDTVTYSGASYINSITHTSTNNTNIDTGYPPNATNTWTVYAAAGTSGTAGTSGASGTDGSPGAGVVFRGNFATGNVYYHSAERRDIVRAGSSFYLANNLSLNNNSGSVWGTPPNSNWSAFGAQFSSVATDVLLAQDATITRGLVMGTEGSNTGFIRSAGASSLLGGTGFYLDVNGRMRFGQEVSGSNNYVYWDGTDLNINGTINAQAGNIGGFTIANNQLIASASLLRIDTQIPQIEFYTNATGSAKVVLNPKPGLTNPGGEILFVTESKYDGTDGDRTAISGTTPVTAFVTEIYSGSFGSTALYAYPTYTPTAFTEGGITNFEVYIPETSLTLSGTTPTAYSDYPPLEPTSDYESYYSEYAVGASANATWYLQMFDSSGTTFISETLITGASTYRTLGATNYYYQSTGFYPGPYYWTSVNYTSPAYYQGNIIQATKAGQINIPAAGTYKFRLVLKILANSAAIYDYVAGTNTYYSTTATTNHTRTGYVYDASSLAGTFNFSPNLNKTEITNGGIQVLSNKDAYVQLYRIEPSAYSSSETIARFVGGKVSFQGYGTPYPANLDETAIECNGEFISSGNYNQIGQTTYTGTGQYNVLSIGGRFTDVLANQSFVSSYSNIRPAGDDDYDLGGASSYRWRDIFTNGAVTTTSDANKKFDIKPSSLGLDFINRLNPVSYRMISGSAIREDVEDYKKTLITSEITSSNGEILKEATYEYEKNPLPKILGYNPGKRTHYGLIAQDIKSTLNDLELTTTDFAGYVAGDIENDNYLGLRYEEFISPIIKSIQELSQKVNNLEAQISGSL